MNNRIKTLEKKIKEIKDDRNYPEFDFPKDPYPIKQLETYIPVIFPIIIPESRYDKMDECTYLIVIEEMKYNAIDYNKISTVLLEKELADLMDINIDDKLFLNINDVDTYFCASIYVHANTNLDLVINTFKKIPIQKLIITPTTTINEIDYIQEKINKNEFNNVAELSTKLAEKLVYAAFFINKYKDNKRLFPEKFRECIEF